MLAFQIEDTKGFTAKLFLKEVFDAFYLVEGQIQTQCTLILDGHFHKEFYSADELDEMEAAARPYVLWRDVRPLALAAIKGTHTPLGFKFSFRLSEKNTEKLLMQSGVSLSLSDVGGLFLNIIFKDGHITVTTGTSLNTFIPDRSLDQAWDDNVRRFFVKQEIV